MELRVEPVAIPEKFSFNYDELKQELEEKVSIYTSMVYTDDQIKSAKADRADLNRLKKALNDERIRQEKAYMKPFSEFKAQINEIIGIIDKPVAVIDKQIKEYEEQKKQEKKKKIEDFFSAFCHIDWLKLSQIWDEKWLNASVSMKSVQDAIEEKVGDIGRDLVTLSDLPEFAFEAAETYKSTLDINKSIAEGHRLSEMQKRKAEQERIKAEKEELEKKEQDRLKREYYEEIRKQEEIAANRPSRPVTAVKPDPRMKQWVSFSALLDTEDAKTLTEFFKSRNIEFKRI